MEETEVRHKSKLWLIPDNEFISIVKSNYCIRDIVEALGFVKTSGSMAIHVKERIKELNIDTSHFLGRGAKESPPPKYDLKDILIENSPYTNIGRLKKRLVKEGLLEYKCEECGNEGYWNGKELKLQLEHKNGKHFDHRLENICFLCPNCHSQTDTYGGKYAKYGLE